MHVFSKKFSFPGNFKAGPEQGTILKKLCPKEELCFQVLMKDVLRPYVPEYKGHVTCEDGDCILSNTEFSKTAVCVCVYFFVCLC